MEESLNYLKEQFHLGEIDIRTYSPLTLAYIGDAIYDLVIRTILVEMGNTQVNKLHKRASSFVKATAQSEMIKKIEGVFTQEEQTIYQRGKNSKPHTTAKNASLTEYKRATGFEAVMGYLYLTNQWERMIDLIKMGIDEGEMNGRK